MLPLRLSTAEVRTGEPRNGAAGLSAFRAHESDRVARGSAHAADERSKTGSYVLNWAAACAVGPGGVRIFILTSGRDPRWVARAERSTYRNVRFRLLVACQVGEFVPLRARWRPLANVLEVDSRRLTAVTEVGFRGLSHP